MTHTAYIPYSCFAETRYLYMYRQNTEHTVHSSRTTTSLTSTFTPYYTATLLFTCRHAVAIAT